ncbi:methylmalonate-semialdehyde dehydrogenase [Violaceomyces palustris]|uniref:Methylmalonate-semialdehyde dehydrogenase n=1 Tax=Violaceomyces palustris TaxID=1673888 RepID=A0ACD0P563_9BASI|nr:methylmalonate-semialdehyde dehydrogenase [Violaceomyces palustris]
MRPTSIVWCRSKEIATRLQEKWKGVVTDRRPVPHYLDGQFFESQTTQLYDVNDPSSQTLLSRTPQATSSEIDAIISSSQNAFLPWKRTSLLGRQQIMLRFSSLLRKHQDDVASIITLEQGKTFGDARGDVLRGLQVVEAACAAPNLMMQDHLEVARDMDTLARREPLGVTASINPFNFPAMCPLWSIPMALVTGNTHIIKPSERVPGASQMIVELAEMAGLPKGVLNIAHGGHDTVNALCDDPRVRAISFVGSDQGGKHVHDRGTKNGKRVQSNLGAKNHAVLLPDADKEAALDSIAGAAFGAAGQRCMALSVLVTVGQARKWIPELVEKAKALTVGIGFDPEVDVGPLISPRSKQRVLEIISSVEEEGGSILHDGREQKLSSPHHEKGNFVGPTIVRGQAGMRCYDEEIFGPVLTVVDCETFQEALELINSNRYGNGASVFTNSGSAARQFEMECEAGQIGINVPIPVPLPMFSWSGGKASALGDLGFYGKSSIMFYTKLKTVTSLWRKSSVDLGRGGKVSVNMPTIS